MKKLSILIVDNNSINTRDLKKIFTAIGHEDIEITDNANDAWSLMHIKDFDCVISAWEMPDMTGIALLRITRNDDNLHFMPFFLTHPAVTNLFHQASHFMVIWFLSWPSVAAWAGYLNVMAGESGRENEDHNLCFFHDGSLRLRHKI